MHQYTHPSAEPKRKATARKLATIVLVTASSKGKKTSQTTKVL